MVSNQEYLYGDHAMMKIISDPGVVRIKLCPEADGSPEHPEGYMEVEGTLEMNLDWFGCNLLIKQVRAMRDKTFGKPE